VLSAGERGGSITFPLVLCAFPFIPSASDLLSPSTRNISIAVQQRDAGKLQLEVNRFQGKRFFFGGRGWRRRMGKKMRVCV